MTKNIQALGPLQEKWLTVLESELLKQASHYLCVIQDDGADLAFCCLGVAEHFVMHRPYDVAGGRLYYQADGDVVDSVLTGRTMEEMKFRESNGDGGTGKSCLAAMNDKGIPFKEIAATVRRDPSVFFTGPA